MAEELNKIFDNIYKSEKESNEQYEYLQKLKDKITTTEKKAEEVENQCQCIEAGVTKKIKRLANREVVLLSMNVRNKCLQERIKELKAENRDLKKTMNELKTRVKSSRDGFFKASFELTDELGIYKQKQGTSLMPKDFQRDNKSNAEGIQDKFVTTCNSSVGNFSNKRKVTNAEKDMWLWDLDFTEDENWMEKIE